jgi:hypothetical protein
MVLFVSLLSSLSDPEREAEVIAQYLIDSGVIVSAD